MYLLLYYIQSFYIVDNIIYRQFLYSLLYYCWQFPYFLYYIQSYIIIGNFRIYYYIIYNYIIYRQFYIQYIGKSCPYYYIFYVSYLLRTCANMALQLLSLAPLNKLCLLQVFPDPVLLFNCSNPLSMSRVAFLYQSFSLSVSIRFSNPPS